MNEGFSDNRQQIEEIKNRIDIVDLIGKYLSLKKAGQNYVALCPFHQEKTPSFSISPTLQRYKCFGCGESGDIFTFVQKMEHIEFPDALKKLAKQAGVELKQGHSVSKYKDYDEINKLAADFYYKELSRSKKAIDYVKKRGLKAETVKEFQIGYAPRGNRFYNYLQNINRVKATLHQNEDSVNNRQRKKLSAQRESKPLTYSTVESKIEKQNRFFSTKFLLKSGLFKNRNGQLQDKFQDRLMFPIKNASGRVVGFSGRVFSSEQFGPKYMNTPETPVFKKSNLLYGLYKAKYMIRQEDLAILVEGQLDVITAHQAGLENVVAPQGTALTQQQLEILKQYTNNILFVFDNDDAGQKAVERGFKLATPIGLTTYVYNPKPYADIDELLKNEPERKDSIIADKEDAFTYLLKAKLKNLDLSRLDDRKTIEKYALDLIRIMQDSVQINFALEQVNKIAALDLTDKTDQGQRSGNRFLTQKPQDSAQIPPRQKYFVQLLLIQNNFKDFDVDIDLFSDEDLKKIVSIIKKEDILFIKDIFERLDEGSSTWKTLEDLIFSLGQIEIEKAGLKKELEQAKYLLTIEALTRKLTTLRQQLALADDDGEQTKILKRIQKTSELINKLKTQKSL